MKQIQSKILAGTCAGLLAVSAGFLLSGCGPDETKTDNTTTTVATTSAAMKGVACGQLPSGDKLIVSDSSVKCDEAKKLIDTYLNDPKLERGGNAQVAYVGAWNCSTSTAAVAKADGYSVSCQNGDKYVRVMPKATK